MTPASPWVYVAVGFATAHVFWLGVLAVWWSYLLRGTAKADRQKKLAADFQMVRDVVRHHQHQQN